MGYLLIKMKVVESILWKSKPPFNRKHSKHKLKIKKKIGGLGHHYRVGGSCSYNDCMIIAFYFNIDISIIYDIWRCIYGNNII